MAKKKTEFGDEGFIYRNILEEEEYRRLDDLSRGKVGNRDLDMEWVSRHLICDLSSIRGEDIPSQSAVGLLRWARAGNEKDFYARYLPSRGQAVGAEADDPYRDDGREVFSIIEEIEKEIMGEGKK